MLPSIEEDYLKAVKEGNQQFTDYLSSIMNGLGIQIPKVIGGSTTSDGKTAADVIAEKRASLATLDSGISFSRFGAIVLGALFIAAGLFSFAGGNGRNAIQLVLPTKP